MRFWSLSCLNRLKAMIIHHQLVADWIQPDICSYVPPTYLSVTRICMRAWGSDSCSQTFEWCSANDASTEGRSLGFDTTLHLSSGCTLQRDTLDSNTGTHQEELGEI